jgi:hypothetical protein
MSIPSNLYAEKVFAEHPIVLWPLDDTVDYVSLINEDQRDFSGDTWQISGGTTSPEYLLNSPFDNSHTTEFNTTGTDIVVSSDGLINQYLSPRLKSITLGFYAYEEVDLEIQDKVVDSYTISITYDSADQPHFDNDTVASTTLSAKSANIWHYYASTFELPDEEIIALDAVAPIVVDDPTNFELSSHGLSNNDRVILTVDGILPVGFFEEVIYYVNVVDSNNFTLSLTEGGDPISATGSGVNTPSIILVKKIDVSIKANLDRETDAVFYLNGLSIGQWAEEFQESSLGVSLGQQPNVNFGIPYSAIESNAYGLSDSKAYYIANNNELLAKNINMPMVFGSKSLTSIIGDTRGKPSIIFPGSGLLNANGQYRTYTVETWIRINANTDRPRRIFGPIASTDGLYIDGPFFTLRVGENFASHYVGQMYRPILLNLIFFPGGASVIINGEKVLDLPYDVSTLSLPENTSLDGVEQDWLGFYSYDDIEKFEIDCFAIYPYQVPTSVAKRRYVYGQAVDFPENITSAYNGKSFPVDYTFSNYSNNYVYPDIGQWRRGNLENLNIGRNVLAPPSYELPELIFDNKDQSAWYSSLNRTYANTITLRPDPSWNNTNGYIYFRKLNLQERNTKAFYGVFEAGLTFSGTETLFVLENESNKNYIRAELHTDEYSVSTDGSSKITSSSHGLRNSDIISFSGDVPSEIVEGKEYFVKNVTTDTFEISEDKESNTLILSAKSFAVKGYHIRYRMKYGSDPEYTVYQTPAITLGTTFVAGMNLDKFANSFGGKVASFVNSRSFLRAYFGGNREFTNTFSGYIYRIGFSTERNLAKLGYLFSDNGTAFLRYQFDGGTDTSSSYGPTETIDAGQAYTIFIDDILSHKASYTLFVSNEFDNLSLDIATSSSWQDYLPLQYFGKEIVNDAGNKAYGISFLQFNTDYPEPTRFNNDEFNSEKSFIRTYVSFQYIEDGANKLEESFTTTKLLSRDRVVQPDSDWQNTKYEVVDNTIIYPPPNVDFDKLAIVMYADVEVEGIRTRPVRLKKLSIAAKSLNAVASNRVYSKLGSYIYPVVEYGFYQDLDGFNPFSIYPDNTPYLYLTKNSGMQLQGSFPSSTDRSLTMRMNSERKEIYSLAAIQTSIYVDDLGDLSSDLTVFEISGKTETYLIKARSVDSQNRRVRLYATDSAGTEVETVGFYLNGNPTFSPTITTNEWNMLGIAFVNPLNMNRRPGVFKVKGPVLFNNLSYYALNRIQEAQRIEGALPYSEYSEDNYIGLDMSRLYDIYTGTNKLITGDEIPLTGSEYRYSVYKDLSVRTITTKPV